MVQDALIDELRAFGSKSAEGAEIEPGELMIDFDALERFVPVIVKTR